MRKFKLKEQVARRLMGLENESAPSDLTQKAPEAPAEGPEKEKAGEGIQIAWRTDVGRIRRNNQDSVILGCGLAGVADGMGGHNGGEIASGGLREGLLRELQGASPSEETLRQAIEKVNLELWEKQNQEEQLSGMGTTLTVIWPAESEMILAQVGDSRAYLLREGELCQMTNDHSMVADMVRKGILTEEQAACHPMRNYITRAVATEETVDVDLYTVSRQAGDRWLICSDGLHGQITKGELKQLLATKDLEEAATLLLSAALEAGGRDNISLVLLQDESGAPGREKEATEGTDGEAVS